MTSGRTSSETGTWRDLSGLQLLIWPCVIVFLLQVLLAGGVIMQGGLSLGGLMSLGSVDRLSVWAAGALGTRGVVENGEWWRLLCPVFLHFSIIHVAMNMWCLFSLGRLAEQLYTRSGMVVIFITTGLGGVVFSFAWTLHSGSTAISAGASGAVCGLLGLLLSHLRGRQDAAARFYARQLLQWTMFLAIWSLLPGISFSAHLGGFVTGYVLGKTLPTGHFAHLKSGWRRRALPLCAGGLATLALVAMLSAGMGARERLDTLRSTGNLHDSIEAALESLTSGRSGMAGVITALQSREVPGDLQPAKTRLLEILRSPAGLTATVEEVHLIRREVLEWGAARFPDIFVRRQR